MSEPAIYFTTRPNSERCTATRRERSGEPHYAFIGSDEICTPFRDMQCVCLDGHIGHHVATAPDGNSIVWMT